MQEPGPQEPVPCALQQGAAAPLAAAGAIDWAAGFLPFQLSGAAAVSAAAASVVAWAAGMSPSAAAATGAAGGILAVVAACSVGCAEERPRWRSAAVCAAVALAVLGTATSMPALPAAAASAAVMALFWMLAHFRGSMGGGDIFGAGAAVCAVASGWGWEAALASGWAVLFSASLLGAIWLAVSSPRRAEGAGVPLGACLAAAYPAGAALGPLVAG